MELLKIRRPPVNIATIPSAAHDRILTPRSLKSTWQGSYDLRSAAAVPRHSTRTSNAHLTSASDLLTSSLCTLTSTKQSATPLVTLKFLRAVRLVDGARRVLTLTAVYQSGYVRKVVIGLDAFLCGPCSRKAGSHHVRVKQLEVSQKAFRGRVYFPRHLTAKPFEMSKQSRK